MLPQAENGALFCRDYDGITFQLGHNVMQLELRLNTQTVDIHIFERTYRKLTEQPPRVVKVSFSVNDVVRPWLHHNKAVEPKVGKPIVIADIQVVSKGVSLVIDKRGNRYSSAALQLGLSETERLRAIEMAGELYQPYNTVPYSLISDQTHQSLTA